MPPSVSALDFLVDSVPARVPPVCAIYGAESFLKRQCLTRIRQAVLVDDEGEFSFSAFSGESAEFRDVHAELATRAMFGGGTRMVVVEEADDFVTNYREALEVLVAKPIKAAVLVLLLGSFPSNTRLYKAVVATGLAIDAAPPLESQLPKWLVRWAQEKHQARLAANAASLLVELVGPELGLLDQELAKLALLAGEQGQITAATVEQSVGSWRTRTIWEALDAALAGKAPAALAQLDRLFGSGEEPIAMLAQISASLRRLAAATRLVLDAEANRRRVSLRDALQQAGARFLPKAEQQLRHLGRHRGAQVYQWLLDADLDLKGQSQLSPRLILERLITRLAATESHR